MRFLRISVIFGFAVAALPATAQLNLAATPTLARPITQPSVVAPTALSARRSLLPSGPYRLSIDLPPNGRAPALSATDDVMVTRTASGLDVTVTNGSLGTGQSFTGTIDASGAMTVSIVTQAGLTLRLSGTATADGADGDAFVAAPGMTLPPHGSFEFVQPGQPQARARSNQLVEAVNALLHAIGCWAHGGAGC